jgi:hypothetical protein
MKIQIAERFHPFFHRPGAQIFLPLSTWVVTLYPARIQLESLSQESRKLTLDFSLQGPVRQFTGECDLERGLIRVFGRVSKGYFRYVIKRVEEGIALTFEKIPGASFECTYREEKTTYSLKEKESILFSLPKEAGSASVPQARLSLGNHKKQDWDMVLRRFDLQELLPVAMRLGEMIPFTSRNQESAGTLALLKSFAEATTSCRRLEAQEACEQWLRHSFADFLIPSLDDPYFQGVIPPCGNDLPRGLALRHLTEGARLIRSLFFREAEESWVTLPCLFPLFSAGRLIDVCTSHREQISMEWSKHQLKKMIVHTLQPKVQKLVLPKEIRSFRVRASLKERGRVIAVHKGRAELNLPADAHLFLDCFKN